MTRVAVVDDEMVVRELISRVLGERGYKIDPYEGATSAFDALYDEPPDLLISDINMPDGNGLELVSRLRDRHGKDAFPVLILSTLRSESDYIRGYAAGADEYLSKPFSRDELLAKVAVMLTRSTKKTPAGLFEEITDTPLPTGTDKLAFDRFEIRGVMGQGTYGTVYDAWDQEGEREVALKVLSALHGAEPANRLRFIRESYALSAVDHPNIVSVVDFGVREGRLYYAMDKVDGPNLKDLVKQSPPTERQVVDLLRGLADALGALAEKDLVHRDLKPANILLRGGDYGQPVLADFGLAKRTFDRGVTDPLMLMGTPGYIPPEVIAGEEACPKSDLFALGLVLRFSLLGEEIFPELRNYELLHRIAKGPIPVPPCASSRLQNVIRRLVRTDREKRIDPQALKRAVGWVELDPVFAAEPAEPSGQLVERRVA